MAKWGVFGCGWGDAIVSLTNLIKNDCRNVIYLGKYKEIVPFLEAQDFIDKVRYVEFLPQTEGYWGTFFELALRRDPNYIEKVIDSFKFDRNDQYINCQLGFRGGNNQLELIDYLNFSEGAIEESERIKNEYSLEDFIMFQPTSFHSTPPENYYPYWNESFEKLQELYPKNQIVLIGERITPLEVKHKNFIDLRGKFKSAESIGHLAKSAKFVVTISNNLIYFCHVFDVPTINLCNKEFDCGLAFRRSMVKKTMINVDWRAPKEDAFYVLEHWQEIIDKNTFYKINHHIDFLSKFANMDWSIIKEALAEDYYQDFHLKFDKYVDKDWYFTSDFPTLVALFSLHFNTGKGCTQVSSAMEPRFQESYEFLHKKTTMLRKLSTVSDDFVLYITSKELLKEKRFAKCNHIICINNTEDDILLRYLEENGFEVDIYKNLVYDAKRNSLSNGNFE